MNCTNHPDVPVSAYCQFCGKPLCKDCVRSIGGVVYCEPCLAARVQAPGATYPGASYPGATYPGAAYPGTPGGAYTGAAHSGSTASTSAIPLPSAGPNPMLAGLLGFIPGVGAMYNGQFVKGIAHVIIFAVLTSLANTSSVFGILIAAWVVYQVFDAYQTARARQLGLPLPDPFGLNDLGHRLGLQPIPGAVPPPPASAGGGFYAGARYTPSASNPADPAANPAGNPAGNPGASAAGFAPFTSAPYTPFSGSVSGEAPPSAAYGNIPPYYPDPAGTDPRMMSGRSCGDLPTGAIVLIGLGLLFLFHSLGLLRGEWISHGWPVLIIALGVWLFVRRSRDLHHVSDPANAPTDGSARGGRP